MTHRPWPELDYLGWRESANALQLTLQIVGKYRLAHTPWVNHSWHATFRVTPRGWTTTTVPDGPGLEFLFDLVDHQLRGWSGDGRTVSMPLGPTTVAEFHERFSALVTELGGDPTFHGSPNEVADPVPFREDHRDRPYDRDAVSRYFQATREVDRVFREFRTSFLGKVSPVHLFWGAFDLAVTRFSGRPAPLHPGGMPALPDAVAQEAYDREVSSAGFWPGGGGIDFPAFYSYAYPEPNGFRQASVEPAEAYWSADLFEFVLPYEAVRSAADPDAALLSFLRSTYEAAAERAGWDRDALECAPGRPRAVRTPRPSRPRSEEKPAERPALQINREDGEAKGRYVTTVDGHEAEMTYSRAGRTLLIIDHTGVPDALRGRGVGVALVQRAVDDSRAEGIPILPLCPFAKAQFDRHPEWADALKR